MKLSSKHSKLNSNFSHTSSNKFFRTSAVNIWCSYLFENEEDFLQINGHSKQEHQIIKAISNMKAFSDTFDCPSNTKMNPSPKCQLW